MLMACTANHARLHLLLHCHVELGPNIEFSCPAASTQLRMGLPGCTRRSIGPFRGQLQRFDNITAPPCALLSEVGLCAPRGGMSCKQFPSVVMLTNTTLSLSSRTPVAKCSIVFASITPLEPFPPFSPDCQVELPSPWKASAIGTGSQTRSKQQVVFLC